MAEDQYDITKIIFMVLNNTHRTSFYELHLFSKNYDFNRPTINEEGVS